MKSVVISNAAATSTGVFPSTATYPQGLTLGGAFQNVSVAVVHDSTLQVSWMAQADIAGAGAWTNLNAAPSSSTGSSIVNSTVSGVFTNIRINVSGNQSTGDVTTRWYVIGA